MDWVSILAYITGTVDQELLLRNEYLAAENRILKAQLKTPLRLTDAERMTLAEIAHRLGSKAFEDVANVVKPDTLLGWYRRLREPHGQPDHARAGYSCRHSGRDVAAGGDVVRPGGGDAGAVVGAAEEGCRER